MYINYNKSTNYNTISIGNIFIYIVNESVNLFNYVFIVNVWDSKLRCIFFVLIFLWSVCPCKIPFVYVSINLSMSISQSEFTVRIYVKLSAVSCCIEGVYWVLCAIKFFVVVCLACCRSVDIVKIWQETLSFYLQNVESHYRVRSQSRQTYYNIFTSI